MYSSVGSAFCCLQAMLDLSSFQILKNKVTIFEGRGRGEERMGEREGGGGKREGEEGEKKKEEEEEEKEGKEEKEGEQEEKVGGGRRRSNIQGFKN